MQSTLWSTELISILFIIGMALTATIGFLLGVALQRNKITHITTQIEYNQKALEEANTFYAAIKEELKQEQANNHQKDIAIKGLEEKLSNEEKLSSDMRKQLEEEKGKYEERDGEYHKLDKEYTQLKTTLDQKESHFKEQMQQITEAKQALVKEFENLANKILDEKGKAFTHSNQVNIDTILKPFREQIEGFQKRINDVHDSSIKGNTNLIAEIKKVLDIGIKMSQEADNLTSVLKGDSQQRGAWGEAQLRRTLEMSGLIKDIHYAVQSSFKDAEGRQKQTDYLIKLPDGQHLIIDSKVTLNAYERTIAAKSTEEYQQALDEHIKAVRKHIDDLASKDYTNLPGMHCPSFVLMFMPMEPAYIEALKNNKDLFEYGYKKDIILVSHTTLIPILRTVSNLWMIKRSNVEAREISEKAGEIYNHVCIVAERLSKLGGTLNTVSNHYNSTVKALAGKQGLYGKVERFNQLSVKASKSLPQPEPLHMDFEAERLSLIIEPINDEQTQPEVLNDDKEPDDTPVINSTESVVEMESNTKNHELDS